MSVSMVPVLWVAVVCSWVVSVLSLVLCLIGCGCWGGCLVSVRVGRCAWWRKGSLLVTVVCDV